ncbi:restriction endonuclease subunit S [Streptomyces sp. NPDC020412]|uniref:restriction endonuclease subunit S n=1 Tax=Streptomyces sp. NPDC020412 TaxID=3365073 RepID=UPI0037893A11
MPQKSVKLGRVARTVSGSGFPHEFQGKREGDYPFLKVSDLSDSRNLNGVSFAANWVSRADLVALGARTAPAGSIVFPKVGAALLKNVRRILSRDAAMDNNLMAVSPQVGDSRFWMYALSLIDLGEFAGSGPLPFVSDSQIRGFTIPFPEQGEQHRIADFLDAETARIDRLASARERQIEILDECEYAEVTDGLIPGSLTSAEGEWPWVWLPSPDRGAPLVRLGYIARLQSGLTVDGKRDLSGDVVTRPYLRVANVQADRIQVDNVSDITVPIHIAKRSTLLAGDVLMTEGGDLDKLGRGTVWRGELEGCLHQNHVFAVRPDALRLDGDYLSLMTRTVHGRCYFESTGVKTTNLASTNSSKILGFPIPLPSLEIQRLRVQTVQRKLDGCARAKQRLRAQLGLLAERRQALIIAAVTGQLDVTTARPAHDRNL